MPAMRESHPMGQVEGLVWRFRTENARVDPLCRSCHRAHCFRCREPRSCGWPAGRAAVAPWSPNRTAPVPRPGRSGRTVRCTSRPCPGVARARDRGPPPGSLRSHSGRRHPLADSLGHRRQAAGLPHHRSAKALAAHRCAPNWRACEITTSIPSRAGLWPSARGCR